MIIKELITCKLEYQIQELRVQMITLGQSKGLTHPKTVKYSQQLDQHLNTYQQFTLFIKKLY